MGHPYGYLLGFDGCAIESRHPTRDRFKVFPSRGGARRSSGGRAIAGRLAMRIGLVGCVKSKQAHAARAKDLYTSPLFRGRRSFVERTRDPWFILSAKHGLVDPEAVIEPYDVTLTAASTTERRRWSQMVLASLEATVAGSTDLTVEFHAGAAYRDFGLVEGLARRGAKVVVPAAGMTQGEQLASTSAPHSEQT
jgi:hypothetical protein